MHTTNDQGGQASPASLPSWPPCGKRRSRSEVTIPIGTSEQGPAAKLAGPRVQGRAAIEAGPRVQGPAAGGLAGEVARRQQQEGRQLALHPYKLGRINRAIRVAWAPEIPKRFSPSRSTSTHSSNGMVRPEESDLEHALGIGRSMYNGHCVGRELASRVQRASRASTRSGSCATRSGSVCDKSYTRH
jgi:hypothetical protein